MESDWQVAATAVIINQAPASIGYTAQGASSFHQVPCLSLQLFSRQHCRRERTQPLNASVSSDRLEGLVARAF